MSYEPVQNYCQQVLLETEEQKAEAGIVQVSMPPSENAMHYLPSFDPHTVGRAHQRGLLHEHVRDMGP
jgi:hypothetical protein